MDKEVKRHRGILEVLKVFDELRAAIEDNVLDANHRGYLLERLDKSANFIDQCEELIPRSLILIKNDINKMVTEHGYAPLDDYEVDLLATKIMKHIDWQSAILRGFWEVVMVHRCGADSGINRRYNHVFNCCENEWVVEWYIDCNWPCPVCGKTVMPTTSIPLSTEEGEADA